MRLLPPRWLLQLTVVVLGGCNLITGADSIALDDDDDGDGGTGVGLGPGATGGTGGTGGSPITNQWRAVDGVTLDAIAVHQGTTRYVMQGHAAVGTGVAVVEQRDALLRLFYTAHPEYNGQPVTARVEIGTHPPLEATSALQGISTISALESTLNVPVPREALVAGAGLRVSLMQPPEQASGANGAAIYPAEGQAALPIQSAGPQLKIKLIPIRYDADGSGRLPDTSDGQVQAYRDLFYALYPTAALELTVGTAVGWDYTVEPLGEGWSNLLNAMLTHRQNEGAPADEYYYGIFCPASSFSSYCQGGCVLGLSPLPGPTDSSMRAGIGIGYGGSMAVETAVHETGHLHGLPHAPCSSFGSIDNVDPSYPHSGASIGEWGYDLLAGQLKGPSAFVDMMSYCEPIWISDYNFQNLFERIATVNGAYRWYTPDAEAPREYERIEIRPDGTAHWRQPLRNAGPLGGQPLTVTIQIDDAQQEIDGAYFPYSHLSGGLLLFPRTERPPSVATWRLDGILRTASRSQLTSTALTHKRR
ncbi:MAG: hypothetical protein JRI23_26335 [Deltaproteobacteria bacterium]|jgi:hypothetical protein|nr:hypothetical protein [Deltaproteobacteria bacterium]MBW2535554.1 hypothetical protein [Deltaproteobacteria bacterium]